MTPTDPALMTTPATGVSLTSGPAFGPLFDAVLEVAGTLDPDQIEPKTLRAATALLSADGASIWVAQDSTLICPVAIGNGAEQLVGRRAPTEDLDSPFDDEGP